MIRSLQISNYALIDRLDLELVPGFNIITGETGAGKSIILGALSLLLGGRADMKVVRNPQAKSIIEAEFDLVNAPAVRRILEDAELTGDDSRYCLLRRELLPGGRSRAFVNDTPVSIQQLKEIGVHLVDIHSQHLNMLITDPAYQLAVVDGMAGNAALLEQYRKAYAVYRNALKDYTQTRENIRRHKDDAEYIAYQFKQLDEMDLRPGEDTELEAERELLLNSGEIKERVTQVAQPLSEGSQNALSLLHNAVAALENLAATITDEQSAQNFHALAERLECARVEAADIAASISEFDANTDDDPARLEEVENRLSRLYSLQSKHHVESVAELISLRDRLAADLAALTNADATLAALETTAKKAKKAAVALAVELGEKRAGAAAALAAELCARASRLGMPNLRCDITITRGKLGPDGADQLQLLCAFNKNQSLMPVGATASGGEISRLMLTLKSIIARKMALPAIIFDEVDTGVSGETAVRMAEMMMDISRNIQVLTITHLPGVAAMGQRHFKVFKQDDDSHTTTRVVALTEQERPAAIAAMLGAKPGDESAIAAAQTLLRQAESLRNQVIE